MFTGIVEEIGTVVSLQTDQEVTLWDGRKGKATVLVVQCSEQVLGGAYIGCSIAVNGVCLTVVAFETDAANTEAANTFTVHLAPETLRKTNLGLLRTGDGVNLERALAEGGRNSGHNVQGHVDGTGVVFSRENDGEALKMVIRAPPPLMKYIVPKGFIAVDGTSLTVVDVDREQSTFSFMLIPHTQSAVVLPRRLVGHQVNLEVDVTAKYVEAQLQQQQQQQQQQKTTLGDDAAPHASDQNTPATAGQGSTGHSGDGNNGRSSSSSSANAPTVTADAEMAAISSQTERGRTVHGAGLRVPLGVDTSTCRVAIVKTCWHDELIGVMRDKCVQRLLDRGVQQSNITEVAVPGSFELPFAVASLLSRKQQTGSSNIGADDGGEDDGANDGAADGAADDDGSAFDVVICMGILLKGGTIHMEVIANAVTPAIMDLQLRTGVPIVFGVLTTLSIEQASERAHSALPESWADSAISMAAHNFSRNV
ncbi:riboflavin synthase [Salpingoeca rosetta]|uniref:Riboflavin synthase n=1 Tax=Salpingoeca rosetta (strain ATCC 50818 / BSB-021) TaxID=946362 RepID=F2UIA8_SALR5|nr:riboflavin synthase [Salpingoeca rosetta]EGD76857.1 riboflavin synthase [Salpingoeca rosetta]|eukprot:XP_004991229.1 riboflavin synthase [Salpingoeca rosetta]